MDISKSDIIESLAGRDKGKFFYVIDTEDNYVLIADGRIRKVENPKKKKLKHLKPIDCDRISEEKLTNRFIREAISEYLGTEQS